VQADHAEPGLELETGHDAVAGPPGWLAGRGGEVPFGLEHEVEERVVGVLVGLPAQPGDQRPAADRGGGGDPRQALGVRGQPQHVDRRRQQPGIDAVPQQVGGGVGCDEVPAGVDHDRRVRVVGGEQRVERRLQRA
jgi:hypothetical protein